MNKEIKSISEAFSMQPRHIRVGENMGTRDEPKVISCINFEIRVNNADVYAGYTEDGEMLFEYIVKSVNVHFI